MCLVKSGVLGVQLIIGFFVATWKQARRLAVLVIGLAVLAVGVALLVLPGPAFVVIPLGLGILAIEFSWARAWLRKLRTSAAAAASRIRQMRQPAVEPSAPARQGDRSEMRL